MKYLGIYTLVIIVLSALALNGNKVFYTLANAYNYLIVGGIVVIAIGIFAYQVLNRKSV